MTVWHLTDVDRPAAHVPAEVTGFECGVCVRAPGHSGTHRITCVQPGSE